MLHNAAAKVFRLLCMDVGADEQLLRLDLFSDTGHSNFGLSYCQWHRTAVEP